MDAIELHDHVIVPTLEDLDLAHEGVSRLILGTGIAETGLEHIGAIGSAPSAGIYAVTTQKHDAVWRWLMAPEHTILRKRVESVLAPRPQPWRQLKSNLAYATAIVRLHYLRHAPLPDPEDIVALSAHWKRWYNGYEPMESKAHVTKQLAMFVKRFPKDLC